MILIINCRLYHRSMSMYCTCACTYVKYCTVCKRRTILFCHHSGRCLNGRGGKIQEPTIFSLMLCRYKARTWAQDFCPTFDDICCQNVARFQQQWTLISKNTGNWSTSKTYRFKSGIEDSFLDSGPFLHEASLIESRAQRQLELQLSKSQVFKKERWNGVASDPISTKTAMSADSLSRWQVARRSVDVTVWTFAWLGLTKHSDELFGRP